MINNIVIYDTNKREVATILNTLLADEYLLYTKARNAHWNIHGANTSELNHLFKKQSSPLDAILDNTAQRVRSLGHFALGSYRNFVKAARINGQYDDFSDQEHIILTLIQDHETIIEMLRKDIGLIADEFDDLGTADYMTSLLEQHENMVQMLKNYLQFNTIQA
jgi:starvation-inducible DNA-binding protein